MMFPPAHWQEIGRQMHQDRGEYRSHDAPVDGHAPGGMPAVRVHMHFARHEADAYANCDPDAHDTLANFMIDGGRQLLPGQGRLTAPARSGTIVRLPAPPAPECLDDR